MPSDEDESRPPENAGRRISVRPRLFHRKVAMLPNTTYDFHSSPNCATYLKLPFDTGRRGYPISVGDIIEMGRGFVVRVVEIDVKTTSSVDKVEKLPPLKETTFGQAVDIRTQVCIRNLTQQTKLSKTTTVLEPAKLVLQLHHKEPTDVVRVVTSPKNTLWFGSLHSSDIICPTLERLHAKIEFDGSRYVLSDFSNATRVVVGEAPVHIVPEDVLVVGDRHFKIVELKDDAVATPGLEIQTLRISARKRSHTKKHMPIKLDLPPNKLLHVGRAPQCNITLSNYSIKLVQFSILYENDRVWVMPLNGSLNQGLYRLLSRQERQREETVDTTVPVVSSVSPLLQLHKDTVFKVGCSEVEVVYIKHQPKSVSATTQDQMNDRYSILQELPWFLLSQNLPGFFSETGHLASHCKVQTVAAGEYIYSQGDDATRAYVVMRGSVLLFRSKDAVGDKFYIESVDRGGSFGEIALLQPNAKHTTNALARSNVVCMVLVAKDWTDYCAPYRDLYLLPLKHGLHETTLLEALAALPYMDMVPISLALQQRVALKMTRKSFPPQSSLLQDPCCIFFVSEGTIEIQFDDDMVEVHSKTFLFDRSSHAMPSLVDVNCLVLSADDFANTIGITLQHRRVEHPLAFITAFDTTPQNESAPPRKLSMRTESMAKPKRKSSLIRAKELWTGVATEDEDHEPARSEPPVPLPPADSWRQKKRNAAMLQSRIEYLNLEASIESALVLYVLSGPNRGDVHIVRNTLTIGNAHGTSALKLRDHALSPQHALIFHRDGKYWLQDCNSHTGTFVRLTDDEACCLHVGDTLLAGDTEFTVLGTPALTPQSHKSASCCVT
ncbi:hypothetical protein B5M09_011248 [Aphanomyces astaci]|uniref:FHA domain-containing protein n=1 Tax=Aphanomyces astaci TaxID=112090 RepID=A0A3R8DE21_APHAT|nr:hypothetical protein B5M09_011248 [Aphanomyces astaci]